MIHKGAFICLFYLIQLRHSVVSDFCDPMDCSTPGFPVHHQLPELAQTHVHWVSDAIQSSHPLSSPSPPAFNLSQHQSLFQWVSSSHQFSSVQFSRSVVSDSLWPHGLQHAGLPCPSPTPRACSNSCPSSWWRHPTVSSSLIPFSSCLLISYCGRWRVAFSGSSHPWSVCVHTHTNTHKHTPSSCHII